MVEAGTNRRAKRYALEIRQWLDSLLNDSDLLECIEFESEYTIEGLSRKVKEYKKENDLYKKEIEYFTYLLNNLGIEYQPFKVKNEIILNDMEEVLSLAHIVNNKLDEIMKLY